MGAKIYDHDGHTHSIKTINEEILGLKINDEDTDQIPEAFGWDKDKFLEMMDTFLKFAKLERATKELYKDLPETSKTVTLAGFLKSQAFKQLNIKIETPNDYFVLGYAFCAIMKKLELDGMKEMLPDLLRMIDEKKGNL